MSRKTVFGKRTLLTLLLALLLPINIGACGALQSTLDEFVFPLISTATRTPFQPLRDGETPVVIQFGSTERATHTPLPPGSQLSIWFSPGLPNKLLEQITLPDTMHQVSEEERSILQLKPGDSHPLTHWVYALAAPFPTTQDDIEIGDLMSLWHGQSSAEYQDLNLLVADDTYQVFRAFWGEPDHKTVDVLREGTLLDRAWRNGSWAILPFEQLEPQWKVIRIDTFSPLEKGLNIEEYPLTVPFSIEGNPAYLNGLTEQQQNDNIFDVQSNYDPEKLTVLAMTGVTALVRATADTMEKQGILYPAHDIVSWLDQADITHISNEVPFAVDCPKPNPVAGTARFCSDPRYIDLLDYVSTDVIELTGDHFADWGEEAMYYTLDLYDEKGWPYYGGGATLYEGREPITLEHNGNKIAFIGCNAKGGGFATASANSPGAVVCDYPYMEAEIRKLLLNGYLPIVTFQYFEYYTYFAQPEQIRDFQRMAEAGAVIVSGSQAHQPQGMEFHDDAFIHYGLGNLFFDQFLLGDAPRQGFIDRHIFYDNKHISTELLTIWFIDFARPRPMNDTERMDLLETVFDASGW